MFSWKSPSDIHPNSSQILRLKFQSLFSWKSPSDPEWLCGEDRFKEVSILVFVEVALGPDFSETATFKPREFQSLFSWKSPSDILNWPVSTAVGCLVSILVFVEVALGQNMAKLSRKLTGRFNPCFRGSRPRTSYMAGDTQGSSSFNPCFRGSRPRTDGGLQRRPHGPEFQSLFSWKSPSDVI